jgi:hypothetical protein
MNGDATLRPYGVKTSDWRITTQYYGKYRSYSKVCKCLKRFKITGRVVVAMRLCADIRCVTCQRLRYTRSVYPCQAKDVIVPDMRITHVKKWRKYWYGPTKTYILWLVLWITESYQNE